MSAAAFEAGRFSSWRPVADGAFAQAPPGVTVVQVKVVGELVAYPTGQSAMLWYGVLAAGELEAAVRAVAAAWPEGELVWRALVTPRPDAELARLLGAFTARFGAPPRLNDAG